MSTKFLKFKNFKTKLKCCFTQEEFYGIHLYVLESLEELETIMKRVVGRFVLIEKTFWRHLRKFSNLPLLPFIDIFTVVFERSEFEIYEYNGTVG